MKNTDLFNPGGSPGSPQVDLSIEDLIKMQVGKIVRNHHRAPQTELITQVETEVGLATAQIMCKWTGEIAILADEKQEKLDQIAELEGALEAGTIPESLEGEESFKLPTCLWRKTAALILGGIGLGVSVFEWVNLAAYRAPVYNSFPISLSYCIPVLLLPVAELVILHGGLFSEKFIKRFTVAQGLLGLLSGAAYLFFCFHEAGASLDFLAASAPMGGLSSQDWCMWTQIVTSLCFAAICFQGALSKGVIRSAKNPAHARAKKDIKLVRQQIRQIDTAITELRGATQRFHALKVRCVAYANVQWKLLRDSEENFQQSVNTILNQKL